MAPLLAAVVMLFGLKTAAAQSVPDEAARRRAELEAEKLELEVAKLRDEQACRRGLAGLLGIFLQRLSSLLRTRLTEDLRSRQRPSGLR